MVKSIPPTITEVPNVVNITPTPEITATPTPEPTSSVIVADPMDRTFNFNPTPRVSIGYSNTTDVKVIPHTIYTENGIKFNGTPQKRLMNILYGPFIVDYTIHPKVNNPIIEWATIVVEDPWGNVIADGGYNRHYPAASNQQMTIYRTGNYSLIMEGNFVTMDIGVRTTDPVASTPVPTSNPEDTE